MLFTSRESNADTFYFLRLSICPHVYAWTVLKLFLYGSQIIPEDDEENLLQYIKRISGGMLSVAVLQKDAARLEQAQLCETCILEDCAETPSLKRHT